MCFIDVNVWQVGLIYGLFFYSQNGRQELDIPIFYTPYHVCVIPFTLSIISRIHCTSSSIHSGKNTQLTQFTVSRWMYHLIAFFLNDWSMWIYLSVISVNDYNGVQKKSWGENSILSSLIENKYWAHNWCKKASNG